MDEEDIDQNPWSEDPVVEVVAAAAPELEVPNSISTDEVELEQGDEDVDVDVDDENNVWVEEAVIPEADHTNEEQQDNESVSSPELEPEPVEERQEEEREAQEIQAEEEEDEDDDDFGSFEENIYEPLNIQFAKPINDLIDQIIPVSVAVVPSDQSSNKAQHDVKNTYTKFTSSRRVYNKTEVVNNFQIMNYWAKKSAINKELHAVIDHWIELEEGGGVVPVRKGDQGGATSQRNEDNEIDHRLRLGSAIFNWSSVATTTATNAGSILGGKKFENKSHQDQLLRIVKEENEKLIAMRKAQFLKTEALARLAKHSNASSNTVSKRDKNKQFSKLLAAQDIQDKQRFQSASPILGEKEKLSTKRPELPVSSTTPSSPQRSGFNLSKFFKFNNKKSSIAKDHISSSSVFKNNSNSQNASDHEGPDFDLAKEFEKSSKQTTAVVKKSNKIDHNDDDEEDEGEEGEGEERFAYGNLSVLGQNPDHNDDDDDDDDEEEEDSGNENENSEAEAKADSEPELTTSASAAPEVLKDDNHSPASNSKPHPESESESEDDFEEFVSSPSPMPMPMPLPLSVPVSIPSATSSNDIPIPTPNDTTTTTTGNNTNNDDNNSLLIDL